MASYEHLRINLLLSIGSIVIDWGAIEDRIQFDLRGGKDGYEFNRQVKSWKAIVARKLSSNPTQLLLLETITQRLYKARTMRDALVHGSPHVRPSDSLAIVTCRLWTNKPRDLKAGVELLLRRIPIPRNWRHRSREAFTDDLKQSGQVELEYPLADIQAMANSELPSLRKAIQGLQIEAFKASRQNP